MDVKDGRALVTGGARGIGRSVCQALLSRGCKVCCADVSLENGKRTVEELQNTYGEANCIFAECDVSSFQEFEEAYLKAKDTFGNLNILINNAGVWKGDKIVEINLKGVINGCDLAFKYMGKNNGGDGGVVVNVSSAAAIHAFPVYPVYSATKAGILALSRCYGQQEYYERSRIKFSVVCPCGVNTEMYRECKGANSEKVLREILKKHPPMEPIDAAEGIIQLIEEGRNGAAMFMQKGRENSYMEFSEGKYIN